jgi:hypothetical protein
MTFPNRQENGEDYTVDLGCSALPLSHEEGCNDWLYIYKYRTVPFGSSRGAARGDSRAECLERVFTRVPWLP